MRLKWFPWRFLLKRLARAHGFIDPLGLVARLSQFAQPSEVTMPLELLRLGVAFHARGVMNTQVIQQNLDWLWPYWVQRQYDPLDPAFVPARLFVHPCESFAPQLDGHRSARVCSPAHCRSTRSGHPVL